MLSNSTLGYSSTEPISRFEHRHLAAILEEDISASQTGKPGSYDADVDLSCFGSGRPEHIAW